MKQPVNARFWRRRAARPACLSIIELPGRVSLGITPLTDEAAQNALLQKWKAAVTRRAERIGIKT